jgi:hypothetical protein
VALFFTFVENIFSNMPDDTVVTLFNIKMRSMPCSRGCAFWSGQLLMNGFYSTDMGRYKTGG